MRHLDNPLDLLFATHDGSMVFSLMMILGLLHVAASLMTPVHRSEQVLRIGSIAALGVLTYWVGLVGALAVLIVATFALGLVTVALSVSLGSLKREPEITA